MEKITSVEELKKAILLLEVKQANEGVLLKEQLMETYESLKPVNLIKKSLSDLTSSPDFKGDLLGTTMSLVAGFLSKKAVVGSTASPIKKVLGTILQIGVTNIVSKNSEGIRTMGMKILNSFFHKKESGD